MKEGLRQIKEEVLRCKKCPLYKYREENNYCPVIGEGDHSARIIFVGEAPGLQEAKTGRPFCGASGKILNELLESAGIKREDVYITNILKDRPPGNRNPQKEEIEACAPYLEKQIEVVKPKALCSLGNFSTVFLMEKYGLGDRIQGISRIHGKVFKVESSFGPLKIIPLYHPAVAVYNANMKGELKKDFSVLKKLDKV